MSINRVMVFEKLLGNGEENGELMGISGFLREVVALKKMDVAEAQRLVSLKSMRQQAEYLTKIGVNRTFMEPTAQSLKAQRFRSDTSFLQAIQNSKHGKAGIIAEIKKASPSKGDIKPDLDPAKYADEYTKAGACAISVLTERHYFKGSLDDLKAVRQVTYLPVLRKDFTLSSYQIYEAKAAGADSILLIVAMLSKEQLRGYVALSRELGMEPLVEINSEWELDKAIFGNAKIIGINNRNLETLQVDLDVSRRVVPFFTDDQIAVEASGISSSDDIQKGLDCGIFSFLVGESIVRAENTIEFIQSLVATGVDMSTEEDTTTSSNKEIKKSETTECSTATEEDTVKRTIPLNRFFSKQKRPAVKICGLTTPEEALACIKAGADAIGFIFYPKSPRYVSPEQAADITRKIYRTANSSNAEVMADAIMVTGVFVDAKYEEVIAIARACSLKAVQLHGNESPSLVRDLAEDGLFVIKALFAGREPHLNQAHLYDYAHAILVEYGKGELPGGNGEVWNWDLAAQVTVKSSKGEMRSTNPKELRIILAGGLNPDNIEKAIQKANPWGVDVSSGVEFSQGRKDIEKVEQLIKQINSLSIS